MNKSFENLIDSLMLLPGIGKRSAERIAFYIINHRDEGLNIGNTILNAIQNVKNCKICGNLTESEICKICEDRNRDRSKICIVENVADLLAIENTGIFNGLYHITGGLISPLDKIGPEKLRIDELLKRIDDNTKEVIIALKATTEGEATAHYISEKIKRFNIRVTRIGVGIPVGGDIDLTDKLTIINALKNRNEI